MPCSPSNKRISKKTTAREGMSLRSSSCTSSQSHADQAVQARKDGVNTEHAAGDGGNYKSDADVVVFMIDEVVEHLYLLVF